MKLWLKNLSFRTKFFLSSFFVTVLMPAFGGWALFNQDINFTKNLIRTNIVNQIDNLSRIIHPAIVFDDNESAFEVLKGFSTNPMIESAVIWKTSDSIQIKPVLFSHYPITKQPLHQPAATYSENELGDDFVVISEVINAGNEQIGTITVTRSLKDLKSKRAEYLQVGIVSGLSIFIIIILITLWYHSSLTQPLKELSSVAGKISNERNYAIRARKISLDEFGRLTDVFNHMLDSLENSNKKLRLANEKMEERVEIRTSELTLSNKRIIQEMSEKEIATQELIKTKDQLNQKEKLANVGQVSSNIAHELRNPMSAIRNATYFLRLKLDKNDKLLEHLEIIDREISRSDEVIQRLLEITQGGDLKKTPTNLELLANEAMSHADVSKTSKLQILSDPQLSTLKLDKLLFKQVLFNIFLNSIQAMPNGGKIQMNINQGSKNMIKINISDEGTGIDKNKITKIFDPLYTDKDEGVGLGLSLCKDLISRHGGTIKAISGQTLGATIEIEIPA